MPRILMTKTPDKNSGTSSTSGQKHSILFHDLLKANIILLRLQFKKEDWCGKRSLLIKFSLGPFSSKSCPKKLLLSSLLGVEGDITDFSSIYGRKKRYEEGCYKLCTFLSLQPDWLYFMKLHITCHCVLSAHPHIMQNEAIDWPGLQAAGCQWEKRG
ncbi:UNVERIFIED_CONTAM: hypothetical protein K2H54_074686 [Gekko kuhli]